jgi:hypothetical protein
MGITTGRMVITTVAVVVMVVVVVVVMVGKNESRWLLITTDGG